MDALVAWNDEHYRTEGHRSEQILTHEEAWLLGQSPLSKYVDFICETAKGGERRTRAAVIDEWRAANDYYGELEVREAGIADGADLLELDYSLDELASDIMLDPRWMNTFDTLPSRLALVELDRLVVSQPHVDLSHTERLKERLNTEPTLSELLRFCLPLGREEAPVQSRRLGSNRFIFWSESSDFRFLDNKVLNPSQIAGHDSCGPLGAAVGLTVGYSSNFLSVIQTEGRLLLHNGYHRAYALRELGVKYAPCVVQTASRRDELALVASRSVLEDPSFYLKAARPPLLKDFFDPKIRKVVRVPRTVRVVEINFEIKEFETTHFSEI
jgi:hypothetical protein